MAITLKQILSQEELPESVEYNEEQNQFLIKSWNTHSVYIDNEIKIEGGNVQIEYTTTDEDGDPEELKTLTLDSELTDHQANSLIYLLKNNFKIKPNVISFLNTQLESYLQGYDVNISAIKNNLSKHIALEIIELLHEDHNGYAQTAYSFSTSWYYHSMDGLDVLMLKDTPQDIAESGMVWE